MPQWIIGQDGERELREMYNRHYSRRVYADGRQPVKFTGPGEHICLTTPLRDALFVWRNFHDDSGQWGICCAIFRNESQVLSSNLIREADAVADCCWPSQRHYTYIRAAAVKSRNPGWCFICAGWHRAGVTKGGLVVLARCPRNSTGPLMRAQGRLII